MYSRISIQAMEKLAKFSKQGSFFLPTKLVFLIKLAKISVLAKKGCFPKSGLDQDSTVMIILIKGDHIIL